MNKAIVVITEGATSSLLEGWIERGLLPGFARLTTQGTGGPMCGSFVPYEVPALLSAFTGRSAGDHGCYSYWAAQNSDYTPRILESSDVGQMPVWRRPELRGRRSAILNVFGTHPATPIDGWLISYPMRKTMRACHPDDLASKLSKSGVRVMHDVAIWYSGQVRDSFVSNVLEADRQRVEAATTLLREGPDLLVLNLTAIDRVSHFYWQELEAGSPMKLEETAVFRATKLADDALIRFMDRMDDRTSLLAFSELGFGPLRAFVSINNILEGAGLLKTGPSGVAWTDTVAFEAVQGTHGVNVNMRGRQGQGRVAPDDYDRVRREVIEVLSAAINPHTGLRLFNRVLAREDIYRGIAADKAPDIVMEPSDERYLPIGDTFWANRVNRTLQSGWHRRTSYWAGIGPAFKRARAPQGLAATSEDVAPTLLRMLDLDVPRDFVGSSLT